MGAMPKLYLLHPVAVHFPIALLTLGLAAAWWAKLRGEPRWLEEAVPWLLWLGTLSAWTAMGLGLLAEETAPHVPTAWKTVDLHETMAFWTVGLFTGLSVWRYWFGKRAQWAFLALWLAASAVLLGTGYFGGELVFTHGMGTAASAEAGSP